MIKPRTISDMWREYIDDRRGDDVELDEFADEFNLNDHNKKIMEMK
jgi:hypothetical protein